MSALDRRGFIRAGLSCGGWVLAGLAGATPSTRRLFAAPRGEPVRTEPWGRLERVADGVWTLISTPLAGDEASGAMRTFSNGGIVAGRDGVLAIEGFATDEGAAWLAGEARRLTGRPPSYVVLTHYHGDHSPALGGTPRPAPSPGSSAPRSPGTCSGESIRKRCCRAPSSTRVIPPSWIWAGAA